MSMDCVVKNELAAEQVSRTAMQPLEAEPRDKRARRERKGLEASTEETEKLFS
jgi:hypothetical protein